MLPRGSCFLGRTRRVLVTWLVGLVSEERLGEQGLVSLAVEYMDRLIIRGLRLRREQLQTLAAACLLVASKTRGRGLTVTTVVRAVGTEDVTEESIKVGEDVEFRFLIMIMINRKKSC